ncbi:hypothetical protein BKA62DRAFT_614212 [Auriculariales sp. MPI-PUGE-AT-0066]|nr:hypothetical protein BKA62DRAFT_614212 [Auriculariales sp. MPI-PUGE-AT-0066]
MSSQSNLSFDAEAYAARKRAREASKISGREYVLYVPSSLSPAPGTVLGTGKRTVTTAPAQTAQNAQQRVLRTGSLKLILAQLDFALKRAAKLRKPPRVRTQNQDSQPTPTSTSQLGTPPNSFTDLQRLRKGKAKAETLPQPESSVESSQRAWWLDVSSPTWDDMRALGKLLHLHPLTLEDIVQREPREKLELFPKLGYYFVSFRAIESDRSRRKARERREGDGENGDEGAVHEDLEGVSMYIVVFREGVCSFHFEDVQDHTERVRQKLLELQSTIVMSSDWICHGLLDSIVDGFFPLFHAIERETESLDSLIIRIGANTDQELQRDHGIGQVADMLHVPRGGAAIEMAANQNELKEAEERATKSMESLHFGKEGVGKEGERLPPVDIITEYSKRLLRRASEKSNIFSELLSLLWPAFRPKRRAPQTQTMLTLMRMTSTRRLVTALGRLLAAKSEVIAQLQKRLAHSAGTEFDWGGVSAEVAVYMGDVQDHIIFLQQSLAHYERILGHSHPAYLSHLRISFSQARGGVDKAVVALTAVTIIVLCMQGVIGIFSMNVKVPRISEGPNRFLVFGCVLAAAWVVAMSVLLLIRLWWVQAKRKYARRVLTR